MIQWFSFLLGFAIGAKAVLLWVIWLMYKRGFFK